MNTVVYKQNHLGSAPDLLNYLVAEGDPRRRTDVAQSHVKMMQPKSMFTMNSPSHYPVRSRTTISQIHYGVPTRVAEADIISKLFIERRLLSYIYFQPVFV